MSPRDQSTADKAPVQGSSTRSMQIDSNGVVELQSEPEVGAPIKIIPVLNTPFFFRIWRVKNLPTRYTLGFYDPLQGRTVNKPPGCEIFVVIERPAGSLDFLNPHHGPVPVQTVIERKPLPSIQEIYGFPPNIPSSPQFYVIAEEQPLEVATPSGPSVRFCVFSTDFDVDVLA
ncbi:hypothetical protein BDN72DRAFT_844197 [Pluteus cervinus]|uniref:Uncharacterized protein n=1 Tax=Pluteus cervinus TaxID=181527 RepID=A0ACD3ALE4_9AGAR|nr:hypothetical protein BDN72DRAFT_844197 [Pluteus cervinus]